VTERRLGDGKTNERDGRKDPSDGKGSEPRKENKKMDRTITVPDRTIKVPDRTIKMPEKTKQPHHIVPNPPCNAGPRPPTPDKKLFNKRVYIDILTLICTSVKIIIYFTLEM